MIASTSCLGAFAIVRDWASHRPRLRNTQILDRVAHVPEHPRTLTRVQALSAQAVVQGDQTEPAIIDRRRNCLSQSSQAVARYG